MTNTPISVGELIDKLSILQVKKNNITDEKKISYVISEFELLYSLSSSYLELPEIKLLFNQLIETNTKLWDIEDRLRILELEKRFEGEFIDFARRVYFTNDERFRLKNEINEITNSEVREQKDYVKYK